MPDKPCSFQGCENPQRALGLCFPHYQQHRRGETLRPLRTKRGEGTSIKVSLSKPLRAAVRADAEVEGVSEGEWFKDAARERLERRGKKAPK